MRQSFRLGKFRGIPVGAHWSLLVVMALLVQGLALGVLPATVEGYAVPAYWLAATGLVGLFMVALLAHELAHAVVAQHCGVRVRSVTLWVLGGVSELEDEPPHPRAELLIALAGPLASVAAAGICAAGAMLAALLGSALLQAGLAWSAAVNLLIAVFNLLPGAPLDGGRVLAAIVWRIHGDYGQARRAAAQAGAVLGMLTAAAGLLLVLLTGTAGGLWLVLIGWYLAGAARSEASMARLTSSLAGVRVGQLMSTPAVCGYAGQSISTFVAGAAAHPHRAYPVVDLDGFLTGLVTLGGLGAVPPARRGETRLADVMIPASRVRVASAQTPLMEAAALLADPFRLAVVVSAKRPCGVLSAGDIRRALGVAELGGVPDRSGDALGSSQLVG